MTLITYSSKTSFLGLVKNKEFYAQAEEGEIAPDYEKFKISGHAQSKLYDKKENK